MTRFSSPTTGPNVLRAALKRATQFASLVNEPIVVLSAIPDSPEYAVGRG